MNDNLNLLNTWISQEMWLVPEIRLQPPTPSIAKREGGRRLEETPNTDFLEPKILVRVHLSQHWFDSDNSGNTHRTKLRLIQFQCSNSTC